MQVVILNTFVQILLPKLKYYYLSLCNKMFKILQFSLVSIYNKKGNWKSNLNELYRSAIYYIVEKYEITFENINTNKLNSATVKLGLMAVLVTLLHYHWQHSTSPRTFTARMWYAWQWTAGSTRNMLYQFYCCGGPPLDRPPGLLVIRASRSLFYCHRSYELRSHYVLQLQLCVVL